MKIHASVTMLLLGLTLAFHAAITQAQDKTASCGRI